MADFPGTLTIPSTILSTLDVTHGVYPYTSPSAAAVWPAQFRAIYVSVLVEEPVTVSQLVVWPTAQSGNLDVGIYAEDGTRLVSKGSTAVGAAAARQAIDITDTPLNPGTYFLAMCVDNTTAAFQRGSSGNAGHHSMYGIQQQAVGAVTLPNPATFATPASTYVPLLQALVMSAVV